MTDLALLVVWGTLVGLDLVTIPQAMIARPFVAGTVAGLILGDPLTGGMIGAILELFAFDVLPVGAVRYPDYGLGAVAGATAAAGAPGILGVGVAVALGLLIAYLGQLGMGVVRRLNTADVRRVRAQLDEGDGAAVVRVHVRGFARDVVRAAAVTGVGLVCAALVRNASFLTLRTAVLLTIVLIGAALGTASAGTLRFIGGRTQLPWLVVGLAIGVTWMVLR